jgi:hypothetical protein
LATHRENVKGLYWSQSNETGTSSPYSSDLAPSDFFLFGDVKGKLMGYRAETPSELLVYIRYSGGNPAGDLERSFSRMDGAIAEMRADRWSVCRMS